MKTIFKREKKLPTFYENFLSDDVALDFFVGLTVSKSNLVKKTEFCLKRFSQLFANSIAANVKKCGFPCNNLLNNLLKKAGSNGGP